MNPILINYPVINLTLHSYGALIIVGLLLALTISKCYARKLLISEQNVEDFIVWGMIGAILGARLIFVIIYWEDYIFRYPYTRILNKSILFPSALAFWEGGLVYWGGFLGGIIACILFTHYKKIRKSIFLDVIILGVPIAQTFGRLGCLFAGCCYGAIIQSENAIGLKFCLNSPAFKTFFNKTSPELTAYMISHNHTPALFPVQLLEASMTLIIYCLLLLIAHRKYFHGQVFICYSIFYSVGRIMLEIFRGDPERGYFFFQIFSVSQLISFIIILYSILICVLIFRKTTNNTSD